MFIFKIISFFTFFDVAENWQLGLQEPATPIMEGIIDFHHDLMFFIIIIVTFVFWILARCIIHFTNKTQLNTKKMVHGTFIEIIWTSLPAILLLVIAVPSFSLLYSMDELVDPVLTIKVIGHQWYWSYEYSDEFQLNQKSLAFDSYMLLEEDLNEGQYRLLEVDNRVCVPVNTHVRILISSSDVLHSWAIPSLGIKSDACPGRLNQVSLFIKREGVFYGQCSEICGINHGFMPIVIESVSMNSFLSWLDHYSSSE